jgi:hypothetical protein
MKLSATPQHLIQTQLDYLDQRWKQLQELEVKRSDAATNYLFLVSSGGSAAVLAYIGNIAKDQGIPQSALWMLGYFAISPLLVGFLKGTITMHVMAIFKSWRTLVRRYHCDEIGWKDVIAEDNKIVYRFEWLHLILGWTSFVFLCLGVGTGFFNLLEEASHVNPPKPIATVTVAADNSCITKKRKTK